LTKALVTEYQAKESYQALLAALSVVRQGPQESVRELTARVRELQARLVRSLGRIAGAGAQTQDPATAAATLSNIEALVLRSFVGALRPEIQEIVAWKQPTTFEAAFEWAQRKEENLNNISPLLESLINSCLNQNQPMRPPVVAIPSVKITNPNATTDPPGIAKMIEEMKDLKLYLFQGQNSRAKSPVANNYENRTQYNRSVQFVTCHNC
jgi:hypothetical protein